MIKTHPIKTLAFFSGCGAVIGTGYYAKLRIDTDSEIRKEAMMNHGKLKYQRDCDDIEVQKESMMNMEKLKYQRESNDEEIRKLTVMNQLKNEEISIYKQRIPWIIRWLM